MLATASRTADGLNGRISAAASVFADYHLDLLSRLRASEPLGTLFERAS